MGRCGYGLHGHTCTWLSKKWASMVGTTFQTIYRPTHRYNFLMLIVCIFSGYRETQQWHTHRNLEFYKSFRDPSSPCLHGALLFYTLPTHQPVCNLYLYPILHTFPERKLDGTVENFKNTCTLRIWCKKVKKYKVLHAAVFEALAHHTLVAIPTLFLYHEFQFFQHS